MADRDLRGLLRQAALARGVDPSMAEAFALLHETKVQLAPGQGLKTTTGQPVEALIDGLLAADPSYRKRPEHPARDILDAMGLGAAPSKLGRLLARDGGDDQAARAAGPAQEGAEEILAAMGLGPRGPLKPFRGRGDDDEDV